MNARDLERREILKDALNSFRNEFYELLEVFFEHGQDNWGADWADDYPFEASFDELAIAVGVWVNTQKDKLDKETFE